MEFFDPLQNVSARFSLMSSSQGCVATYSGRLAAARLFIGQWQQQCSSAKLRSADILFTQYLSLGVLRHVFRVRYAVNVLVTDFSFVVGGFAQRSQRLDVSQWCGWVLSDFHKVSCFCLQGALCVDSVFLLPEEGNRSHYDVQESGMNTQPNFELSGQITISETGDKFAKDFVLRIQQE